MLNFDFRTSSLSATKCEKTSFFRRTAIKNRTLPRKLIFGNNLLAEVKSVAYFF